MADVEYIQTRDIVICEEHMNESLTDECLYCCIKALTDQLQAALPKWTKDNDGRVGVSILVLCGDGVIRAEHAVDDGDWRRPLCDLDYPPGVDTQ